MKNLAKKNILVLTIVAVVIGFLWFHFSFRIFCTDEDLTAACFAAHGVYEASHNEGWSELITKIETNICSNPEDAALILGIGPLDTHPGEKQLEFFIRIFSNAPECAIAAINKVHSKKIPNVLRMGKHLRHYDFDEALMAKKNIQDLREKSESAAALAKSVSQ